MAQNGERQTLRLTIPVLGIGGEESWGTHVAEGFYPAATDVQTAVIPAVGHWVAEQGPQAMLATLGAFLAPYRAGTVWLQALATSPQARVSARQRPGSS